MNRNCECGGYLLVYATTRLGNRIKRYMKCNKCGRTAKQLVPVEFIQFRRPPQRPNVMNGDIPTRSDFIQ